MKRLPDAEFEVMRAVWRAKCPVTTPQLVRLLNESIDWKPQTVMTMLVRLIEKGFLHTSKTGRERSYVPAVAEEDYLRAETSSFVGRFSGMSYGSLVRALCEGDKLTENDIAELKEWMEWMERRGV